MSTEIQKCPWGCNARMEFGMGLYHIVHESTCKTPEGTCTRDPLALEKRWMDRPEEERLRQENKELSEIGDSLLGFLLEATLYQGDPGVIVNQYMRQLEVARHRLEKALGKEPKKEEVNG